MEQDLLGQQPEAAGQRAVRQDAGRDRGAALAFLVSGSAVSIWGVLAVLPILQVSTTVLFVALAATGSLAIGYAFDAL
jgi:hypothetical protein